MSTNKQIRVLSNTAYGSGDQAVYIDKNGLVKTVTNTVKTSVPENALFTDEKVSQKISTTNASYPLLASGNANASADAVTNSIFSSNVKLNPSTGTIEAKKLVSDTPVSTDNSTTVATTQFVKQNILHYGISISIGTASTKTVTIDGFILQTGAKIAVKFTYDNTASNCKLNVNSTGEKSITLGGIAIPKRYLVSNRIYELIYDGTNYEVVSGVSRAYVDSSHVSVTEDISENTSVTTPEYIVGFNNLRVYIDGIRCIPDVNYSEVGTSGTVSTSVTFSGTIVTGTELFFEVIY